MAYRIDKFKYHSCYQGDEGLVLPFQEAATQTFVVGDLVKLVSGKVTVSTASSTDVHLGFALTAATGTTDSQIMVQVIRPSDVFIVHMAVGDTFAVADTGLNFEAEDAASGWSVNQASTGATTEAVFRVLGTAEWDSEQATAATALGPVYVSFNPSNIVMGADV